MENLQKKTPLGLTLCNPANIRWDGRSNWKGLEPLAKHHHGFCCFTSFSYGIRALIALLRTYYEKHHLNTVADIISRYAPPSENDTAAYIRFVCLSVGVTSNSFMCLEFSKPDVRPIPTHDDLYKLCCAILRKETGFDLSLSAFYEALLLL